MSEIALHTHLNTDITMIENSFIDHYMPKANGEYVKLYLYLLRLATAGRGFTISQLADTFENTEKDILRALKYWEKEGLLSVLRGTGNKPVGVTFIQPAPVAQTPPASMTETATTSEPVAADPPPVAVLPDKSALTADRRASLQDQEEVQQLLFIASQYLGKTLSPTEISNILYFYDTLNFSSDLIEYLIEYCVSKGSKSSRYMEKVALEWAKEGITTVEEAKSGTNLFHKNYYTILNAFGIKGRGPAKPEIDYMDQWINAFHFTMDIIIEACNRTITQTQRPNFQYANKILSDWHKNNVKHLDDIAALDTKHANSKKSAETKTAKTTANTKNRFNNFEQRKYDYDSLEEQLLNANRKS